MSHTPPLCGRCGKNYCFLVGQTLCTGCLDDDYNAQKAKDTAMTQPTTMPIKPPAISQLFDYLERLLAGTTDVFAVATGGGASFIAELAAPPGASSYLKGSAFPYDPNELNDFLGLVPERYASDETALAMACEAFVRARTCTWRNHTSDRTAIGIGITASIASSRAHRGDHRVHIAVVSNVPGSFSQSKTVVLEKGVGLEARIADEALVCGHARTMMRAALGMHVTEGASILSDTIIREHLLATPVYRGGRRGDLGHGLFTHFPGTFNPLHDGHRDMAGDAILRLPRQDVVHSINIDQPHKAPLTPTQMLDRVAMFRAETVPGKLTITSSLERRLLRTVMFTQGLPLFIDKIKKFPQSHWIVGADTLNRLLDPKWGVNTHDVLLAFMNTSSTLHVYPCEIEGKVASARDVLNWWRLLPQTNGEMPGYIVDVPLQPANIRSSQIREAAGAR